MCPECGLGPYKKINGLNLHRALKHGYKSPLKYPHESLKEMKAPNANGKQTTIRATRTEQLEIEHHSNGSETVAHDEIPEATLAVAFGQFRQLCLSLAVEYDLPPRLFTHRLSELIHSSTLRQSSRRPM